MKTVQRQQTPSTNAKHNDQSEQDPKYHKRAPHHQKNEESIAEKNAKTQEYANNLILHSVNALIYAPHIMPHDLERIIKEGLPTLPHDQQDNRTRTIQYMQKSLRYTLA